MIETWKILSGKVNIKSEQFFKMSENVHSPRRHSMKIHKQQSRLDIRKYFYCQKVVNQQIKPKDSGCSIHPSIASRMHRMRNGRIWTPEAIRLNKSINAQVQVWKLVKPNAAMRKRSYSNTSREYRRLTSNAWRNCLFSLFFLWLYSNKKCNII